MEYLGGGKGKVGLLAEGQGQDYQFEVKIWKNWFIQLTDGVLTGGVLIQLIAQSLFSVLADIGS